MIQIFHRGCNGTERPCSRIHRVVVPTCSRDIHWALPECHFVIHLMWLMYCIVNENHTDGLNQRSTRCILIKLLNYFLRVMPKLRQDSLEQKTQFRIWNTPELYQKAKIQLFRAYKNIQTLEKLILEGKVKGQRNRGRPKRYWEKDVEDWMGARVWRVGLTEEDRMMYGRSVKAATSGNG